jgi:Mg2+-importing ATPase
MVEFGVVSSMFDFMTFGLLIAVFRATPDVFRTAWFVESLLTELAVALVMRTRRVFFRSRPGRLLLLSTLVLVPITFAIPYAPFAAVFGFVPLPAAIVTTIAAIVVSYVAATEVQKMFFYR